MEKDGGKTARYEEAGNLVYLQGDGKVPLILLKFMASLMIHYNHNDEKLKEMCDKMHGLKLTYSLRGQWSDDKTSQPFLNNYLLDDPKKGKIVTKHDDDAALIATTTSKYSYFYENTFEQRQLKQLVVKVDGIENGDYRLTVHHQELYSERNSHCFLSGLYFYEPNPSVKERISSYWFKFRKHFADQHAERLPRFLKKQDDDDEDNEQMQDENNNVVDVAQYLLSFRVVKRTNPVEPPPAPAPS